MHAPPLARLLPLASLGLLAPGCGVDGEPSDDAGAKEVGATGEGSSSSGDAPDTDTDTGTGDGSDLCE